MTNERISEIRARFEAATPGPWKANWLDDCFIEPRICMIPANGCYDYDKFEANSEFIAHAREDIPYLLSQLAERDKELKRLQKEVASLAIESIEREKTLAKLEAEVMQLWEAQRWTDAEYDTPDIGQAVLLYMPDKETDNIRAGEYMGEGDYRIGNKLYRGMEIDAWLPLPAPPERIGDADKTMEDT